MTRNTAPAPRLTFFRLLGIAVFIVLLVALVAGGLLAAHELRHSRLQAREISRFAQKLDYAFQAAPSDAVRYPAHGPFDRRMGYTELPRFAERLRTRGFELAGQTRFSEPLIDYVDRGFFVPYREKTQAGFSLADCRDETLYRFRYPFNAYPDFAAAPRAAQAARLAALAGLSPEDAALLLAAPAAAPRGDEFMRLVHCAQRVHLALERGTG